MRYGKDAFGKGVDAVWGIPKEGDGVEVQALRFSKDKFPDKSSVSKWIDEHKDTVKKKEEEMCRERKHEASILDARNFPTLTKLLSGAV